MSRWLRRLAGMLAAAAVAVPAFAAAQLAPGGQHDNSQPIEITADTLEVQQDKQLAIFRGNVNAIQGDIHLKAETLQVHYRQRGPAAGGQARSAPAGGDPAGAISRIDAIGKVFISSPEETARGESGVYDVDRRTIVLEGKEVVLTRGENVLKGQRVTMNLNTGKSVMETRPGGRVRGLFVPSSRDDGTP